ncbi:uncharacterized protein LOC120354398 [Nilaparvata lugens]|uniref:uncharacterized protein LOC120354398 n=1 Tax=Nilaparvata lugens TaxID=108931 RepID=UPI00193DE338|nr:uncharacterized protein LOC120354398 [Nilaparvata lugens]
MSLEMVIEVSAVLLNEYNTIVVSLYRPNTNNTRQCFMIFMERLACILEYLSKHNSKIVFCGDFNVDFKKRGDIVSELKNTFLSYGLSYCFEGITRPGKNYDTCIDNIFTNVENHFLSCEIVKTLVSDHWALLLAVKCKNEGKTKKKTNAATVERLVRSMNNKNIYAYECLLSAVDWYKIYLNNSLDMKVDYFLEIFLNVINKAFPLKRVRDKTTLPKQNRVYNPELNCLEDKCDWLYDIYSRTGSSHAKALLKKYKKSLKKLLEETRRKKNDNFIESSSNKSKAIWSIINSECNKEGQILVSDSKIDPFEFNNFFVDKINEIVKNVSQKVRSQNSTNYLCSSLKPSCSFKFSLVSKGEVESAINTMKAGRCEVVYGINTLVVKLGMNYLSDVLTHIINSCILSSIFPDALKRIKVIPIFKKGCKSECNSFRPISIVPIISKVFEKVLNKQIVQYFEVNRLFSDCQYGYRAGLGTVKATVSLFNFLIESLEKKNPTEIRLFDLSRAFDTVSHEILLFEQ